jgi:hypothetical protein
LQDRRISATVEARGSLERLHVTLAGDDAAARAQVEGTLRVFAAVPIESLDARIDALDPSHWLDGVPSMQLSTHDSRSDAAQHWTLGRGGAHLQSRTGWPGRSTAIDCRPDRRARTIAWDDETLTVNVERAEGLRGSAEGRVTWSGARGVVAQARFSGIDAATLHSRGVASDLSGTLDYTLHDGEQRFSGTARNARGLPLSADFEASLRQNVIEIARAQLRLGDGRAEVQGRIELAGALIGSAHARCADPRRLRGVDTRLDGSSNSTVA